MIKSGKICSLLSVFPSRDEKGITLLEVLFSIVVIGIVVVGYVATLGTAVSTNEVVADTNLVAALAFGEMEQLRSVEFGQVPFVQTGVPGNTKEVPNLLHNFLPDIDATIISTGDLSVYSIDYPRDAAADGLRADDTTVKWVGARNLLTDGVSEGPDADGPWNQDTPGGGGGDVGGPDAGGPGNFPEGYQFWMVDLGAEYKISRVIYDNRFNIYESDFADLDQEVHIDDVWQDSWRFFFRETPLELGEPFDPRFHGDTLANYFIGAYATTGVNVVWDMDEDKKPLFAGVLGVTEIDTYADFDEDFHWPYVNEVEVYGFDVATEYVREYTDDGVTTFNNIIMYFPNYKDSGFDMGRRSYTPPGAVNHDEGGRQDLIRVEIEFYGYDRRRNTDEWMETTWWQEDTSELTRYTTSFYREKDVHRDNLPLISDLPVHRVYYDNEDIFIEYYVPDATAIRFRFSIFDLQPDPSTDFVQFYDKDGNLYGQLAYYGTQFDAGDVEPWSLHGRFGPWVPGDTIVIRFHSDGLGNSLPPDNFLGFEVGRAEVRKAFPF